MADKSVNIKLTAGTDQYEAAMQRARASLERLSSTADQAKARQQTFNEAMSEVGDASAKTIQQVMKMTAALDKEAAAAGKTRGEIRAMAAESLGVTNAFEQQISAIKAAEAEHDKFSLATTGARREVMVLAHELATGNFKRAAGSMMVLGERTGGLGAIFSVTGVSALAFVAAIALTVEKTYSAAQELEDYADKVQRASQVTGVGTKEIQEWGYMTASLGMSTKQAASALQTFAQAQNKAVEGNRQAQTAFAALGISMAQLKTESPQQALYQVADAFSASQDGASKAAVATALFGASGEDLIPLLNKGSSGVKEFQGSLDTTGGVLNDLTVKKLAAYKQAMDDSKARMEASTTAAKAQLIPAILAVTDAFSDNVAMKDAIHDFYVGVEYGFKGVASAAATFVVGIEQSITVLGTLGKEAKDFWDADFSGMVADAKGGYAKLKDEGKGYADFMANLWNQDYQGKQKAVAPPGNKQIHYAKGEPKQKAGNENALNGQLEQITAQIQTIEQARQTALQQNKADFDTGISDIVAYYTSVKKTNDTYYAEEVALYQKRADLAQSKKELAARTKALEEVQKINHAWQQADAKAADDMAKAMQARATSISKYKTLQDSLVKQQQGGFNKQDATKLMSKQAASDYTARLALQEKFEQESAALKAQYEGKDQTEYKAKLQILEASYGEQEQQLNAHLAREQQIRNSYSAQIGLAIKNFSDTGKTNAEAMAGGFTTAFGQIQSAMDTFITTGKMNWSSLASSILADFAKIEADQAFKSLFGMLGSSMGGSGGGFSLGSLFGGASGFATGGHITGPGTGTSDSIPAMLSNGEFVINAASTKKYRGLLESINQGHMAHFATGGAVDGSSYAGSGGSAAGDAQAIHMHFDGGGLTPEDLKTLMPHFKRLIDQHLSSRMRGQGGYAYQMRYSQI